MKSSAVPIPAPGGNTKRRRNMLHLASDEAAKELSIDEVAIIFGFLSHVDIMHARVCSTWREAAKKATPLRIFYTHSIRTYNAMRAMSTALPNLQKISIHRLSSSTVRIQTKGGRQRQSTTPPMRSIPYPTLESFVNCAFSELL